MKDSKELKEKIITELAVKNLAEANSLLGVRREHFTEGDFREVQQVISENIKHHINEWRIEEVVTFNGYYGGTYYGEIKESMLLHQSVKLGDYDEEGVLNTEPWKMFRKKDYPAEQWSEIEQILNQSQQQSQIEQPPKSKFPFFDSSGGGNKY